MSRSHARHPSGARRSGGAARTALQRPTWSPAVTGPALGALNAASMASAGRPLGVTTAFEDGVALLAARLAPRSARLRAYRESRGDDPELGWEHALVVGLLLGSWASHRLGGSPTPEAVPARWEARFGASRLRRYAGAFVGGAVMMFGARAAGGCTSGHGISGTAQLGLSSWVFSPLFALAGAAVAGCLYGRANGEDR